MQLNVKHYLAIGLGFGIAAAYCLHLGSDQVTTNFLETNGHALQALSKLDTSNSDPPTPDVLGPTNFVQLQQAPVPKTAVAPPFCDNDFSLLKPAHDASDAFAILPTILTEAETTQRPSTDNLPIDMESPGLVLSTDERIPASAAAEALPKLPVVKFNTAGNKSNQPRQGWKKNPFVGKESKFLVPVAEPQTVSSLQDAASQTARTPPPIGPEDRLVQVASRNQGDREGRDFDPAVPSAGFEGDASRLLTASVDLKTTPDKDSDNAFVSQLAALVHETNMNSDSVNAQEPSLVVPLEDQETGVPAVQTELSLTSAQQAAQHIEYGKSLSRRGAVFAARQEFYLALHIVAQSKDDAAGGTEFCRALTRGFQALNEVEGFDVDDIEAGTSLDVVAIVETHRSNVMTKGQAESLSPSQATRRYIEFAREQLDLACGRNAVSAEALFCLGKLYSAVSKTQSVPSNLDTARSIAFHQAALRCDEKNYRSANELGVLMAQTGRLQEATEFFKQSLIVNRTPQAWMNLAKTHRRLGETELAELAESEFALASQATLNPSTSPIAWMPTENFNALAPPEYQAKVASKPADLPKQPGEQNKFKSMTKSFSERLKGLF